MLPVDLLESDARQSLADIPVAKLSGKTILITGASGIIGTHLLYALWHCQKNLGVKLHAVGVVHHEVPEHLRNIERLGYVQFVRGDLANEDFLRSLPTA